MSIIHFAWYGPYKGYEYLKTVNDMAIACQDHEIWFWCEQPAVPIFMQYLHRRVKIKACSLIKEVVGAATYNGENKKWFEDAQDILIQLDQHQAFAAIKDMLCMIILYTYGGYYFDTTVFIPKDTDKEKLNSLLKKDFSEPRFAQLPVGSPKHSLGLQTPKTIREGVDMSNAVKPFFFQLDVSFDVWAIYGPKGHKALELMFMSYVSRCNRMGLYCGGRPLNIEIVDGNVVLEDTSGGKGSPRNKLLGRLVMHAVYDGMLVECCDLDAKKLGRFGWPAQFADGNNVLKLPALALSKRYYGSWR